MTYRVDPNYHSLDRMEKWDEVTQGVIKKRLEKESDHNERFVFLTKKEGARLAKLIDILLPQSSEQSEGSRRDSSLRFEVQFRIKIAETIDKSLSDKKNGSVKYGEDPWRAEFYRTGLKELGKSFTRKAKGEEERISSLPENRLKKELENPKDSFLARFLRLVLQDSVSIYYSHPFAWDKIGFPGPAYPEGYAYLGCGEKDEWEPKYLKK